MKLPRLEIPAFQNWSCHNCSECCRGHLMIELSPQEKQRLEQQGWTRADHVDPSTMIVANGAGHRLGHQTDGACVFLDATGRCRIHAKFGEAAKPLACRLYPLVIHPAGKNLVVGLRFSCPSGAANLGPPLSGQTAEIQKLARLVVPGNYQPGSPPPIIKAPNGEWPDLLRFVHWLDTSLAAPTEGLALKLIRSLHWLAAVEQARLDCISGPGAEEILETLVQDAAAKIPTLPVTADPPSRFGRLFLRMMVFEHARTPSLETISGSGPGRWQRLVAMLRLMRAKGHTPALRPGLGSVRFPDIEKSGEPLTPAQEAMLTRYFRVKVQSLHFCGRAFHNRPLTEGFRSLTLLFPVLIWLSRWLALSADRQQPNDADVARALSLVDYHQGYSPYLEWRVRLLQQRDDIRNLCVCYGR